MTRFSMNPPKAVGRIALFLQTLIGDWAGGSTIQYPSECRLSAGICKTPRFYWVPVVLTVGRTVWVRCH
jgi:hypothetical protein